VKAEDARTLVGFLKGAFPAITAQQMEVYESGLVEEDATFASKAILDGIRHWRFAPTYAEIMERIKEERRKEAASFDVSVDPFSRPMPFWVKRWIVARFVARPPDMRPFREQFEMPRDEQPEEDWMPDDAWVAEAKSLSAEQIRQTYNTAFGVQE
jgi:hypothetical protein